MRIGKPVVIERLYDWLPAEGENRIIFDYCDSDITIGVEYDGDKGLLVRDIIFRHVSYFFKGPIPGINLLSFDYSGDKIDIDCVIEYTDSEFADNYSKYYLANTGIQVVMKHYFVSFTAANMTFHIFAESFCTSE